MITLLMLLFIYYKLINIYIESDEMSEDNMENRTRTPQIVRVSHGLGKIISPARRAPNKGESSLIYYTPSVYSNDAMLP